MTRIWRISILFLVALSTSSFHSMSTGSIIAHIKGIRNSDGQFMLSLSKGPEGFPNDNYYRQLFIEDFDAPETKIELHGVPYGDYALSVLHDEDENNEMTSNFVGWPKEGFGFSRNFQVSMRAPKYEEVNFTFDVTPKTVIIQMQYK